MLQSMHLSVVAESPALRATSWPTEIGQVNLFKLKVATDKVRQLKDLVREVWALEEGVVISVMEVECLEANCPSLETNIILMSDGCEALLFKVFKPIAEVTSEDIVGLKDGS